MQPQLDLAAAEAGRMGIKRQRIGLPDSLDELARQQQPVATAAAVTVASTCHADLRIEVGDPLRLQQVAGALIPASDAERPEAGEGAPGRCSFGQDVRVAGCSACRWQP